MSRDLVILLFIKDIYEILMSNDNVMFYSNYFQKFENFITIFKISTCSHILYYLK